jgi:serine/threonine protein kinase
MESQSPPIKVSESTPETFAVGGLPRAFGPYLLFDRIGRGGMAEIFLARQQGELGSSRRVVIKEVLPELSLDEAFARMLVREAKLAACLRHRNIVQVLDLGRESDRLFIAMEYVEGYDLNQLLRQLSRRRLPLPMQFALHVVREVLQALEYAHRAVDSGGSPLGMVHRDISPSNVLVSFDGDVSLCDFGIARAIDADPRLRATDALGSEADERRAQRVRVAGKSAYMAPEHARGESIDARSDLFAAGIVLWELCAGRRLYRGTEAEMQALAQRGDVPRLPDRGFPNTEMLQSILDRALAVDPAARFQSAGEMSNALEDYALSSGLMASQLRFGTFLTDHFAEEIVALRRARERAAEQALSTRDVPIAEVEPVTAPSERPSPPDSPPSAPAVVAGATPRRRASDAAPAPAPIPPVAPAAHAAVRTSWLLPMSVAVAVALLAALLWSLSH